MGLLESTVSEASPYGRPWLRIYCVPLVTDETGAVETLSSLNTYYGLGTLHVLVHLIPTTIPLCSYLCYPHFTDEKTTAQVLTHLHKVNGAGRGARFEPRQSGPQTL